MNLFLKFIFLFILIFQYFNQGAMANPRNRNVSIVAAPEKLYHWTRRQQLRNLVNSDGVLQFTKIGSVKGSKLSEQHAVFRELPGLFTWSHPLTGAALNEREHYSGEALIEFTIDIKNARALLVESWGAPDLRDMTSVQNIQSVKNEMQEFKNVDLVLHTFGPKEAPLFQEWVILNPKIIKNFTSDPSVLGPKIKEALGQLRDEKFTYSKEELYSFVRKILSDVPVGSGPLVWNYMPFRIALADFIEKTYFIESANSPTTSCVRALGSNLSK